MLFEVGDAGRIWQELLDRDVLVRNYKDHPRLKTCLRVTAGLPDETNRLLASELQSLTLDEIRRRLPEGVTLVQYSVLRDSVLIWTLRRSGKNEIFSRQTISRSALEDKVVRLWAFDTPDGDRAACPIRVIVPPPERLRTRSPPATALVNDCPFSATASP